MNRLDLFRSGNQLKNSFMGKDINEILWWFFTGLLGIIALLGRYIWNNKDKQETERINELKEIKDELKKIAVSVNSIPSIEATLKNHTAQIHHLTLLNERVTGRVSILERDSGNGQTKD